MIVQATRRDMAAGRWAGRCACRSARAAITLEVILRAVFGVEAERMSALRGAIGELLEPMHTLAMLLLRAEPARATDAPARRASGRRSTASTR